MRRARAGWSPFLDLGGGEEKQNILCSTGRLPRKVYFYSSIFLAAALPTAAGNMGACSLRGSLPSPRPPLPTHTQAQI